jgi:hypothetical protein
MLIPHSDWNKFSPLTDTHNVRVHTPFITHACTHRSQLLASTLLLNRSVDPPCQHSLHRSITLASRSVFLLGTIDEQIDFCFKVYDCMKRDGFITREEMHQLLSPCIVNSPSEEDTAGACEQRAPTHHHIITSSHWCTLASSISPHHTTSSKLCCGH